MNTTPRFSLSSFQQTTNFSMNRPTWLPGMINRPLPNLPGLRPLPLICLGVPNNIQPIGIPPMVNNSAFLPMVLPPYSVMSPLPVGSFQYIPNPPQYQPMVPMKSYINRRNNVNRIYIDRNHPFSQRFNHSLWDRPQMKR